jgi:hypothetical protein
LEVRLICDLLAKGIFETVVLQDLLLCFPHFLQELAVQEVSILQGLLVTSIFVMQRIVGFIQALDKVIP